MPGFAETLGVSWSLLEGWEVWALQSDCRGKLWLHSLHSRRGPADGTIHHYIELVTARTLKWRAQPNYAFPPHGERFLDSRSHSVLKGGKTQKTEMHWLPWRKETDNKAVCPTYTQMCRLVYITTHLVCPYLLEPATPHSHMYPTPQA